MSNLVIYHTNDLHGNINAIIKICAFLRRQLLKGEEFIYVDCGDFLGITGVTPGLINIMEKAGLTAIVPGNHEFEFSFDILKKFLNKDSFTTGYIKSYCTQPSQAQ